MDSWKCLIIKSGGEWVDCEYVGGSEHVTSISTEPSCSISNLRYNIGNVLQGANLGLNYELYCLSHSRSGLREKVDLVTNQQLNELFMHETYPTVYVVHNNPSVGRGDSSQHDFYVPSFDVHEPTPFGYDTEFGSYDQNLEQVRRMASTDWFREAGSASGSHRRDLNLEQPSYTADEPEIGLENDDDDADEDYVLESDTEASEDETEESLQNFTFAEFAAWIQREGGMAKLLDLVHPTREESGNNEEEPLEAGVPNNWLVPVIPIDAPASMVAYEEDANENEEFAEGAYYNSKRQLINVAGSWHIEQGAEYKVERSDPGRLVWRCKKRDDCPFFMRAISRGSVWRIYKLNAVHTCVLQLDHVAPSKVQYKVIAAHVAKKIRHECEILKPKTIMEDLIRDYGVHVKYSQALRARHVAIEMIYGGYDDSYQMLPGYLHMLQMANPGSVTDLEIGADGRFRHCFVALSATQLAYSYCLRPVIVVDGTHLKGKNRGILFVAATKDANEGVYPLAYGLGPIENDESWTWFLTRVRRAYGCRRDQLIVSDAHISIANAVTQVFPDATHALCYYHILQKLRTFGKFVLGLYQRAAYAHRQDVFEARMASIREDKPVAFEKLMLIGPEKWAKSMCPIRRYSFLTSNAAEVFNSRLLWARRLPVCSLIETIRHVMGKWFDERRQEAIASEDPISVESMRKIASNKKRAHTYKAVYLGEGNYRVESDRTSYMVDLQGRSCTCRQFDLDGLPCSHAIAAIQMSGQSILTYVEPYYTKEAFFGAYRHHIMQVPHRDEWRLPHNVSSILCLPPIVDKKAGRPRKNRFRAADEETTNRRRATTTEEGGSSSTRRRAPKRCSYCREPGHTRRRCPGRVPDENSD